MSSVKKVPFLIVFCLFLGVLFPINSSPTSTSTSKPIGWTPVDESDWAIYMAAPAYHFKNAQMYFKAGDKKNAMAELSRGKAFLEFQKQRISTAINQIDNLKKDIASAAFSDPTHFNSVVKQTLNIINRKYRMVPIDVGGSTMFGEAHEYHMKKAKESIRNSDQSVSADEIRQVSAFLKLKAASMGIAPWSKVDSVAAALERLAVKVESGKIHKEKDLEDVFKKATSIFRNNKSSAEMSKAMK